MKTESHLGKATVRCQTQDQEILRDITSLIFPKGYVSPYRV